MYSNYDEIYWFSMSSKPNSLLKNYFKAKMHSVVRKMAEDTVHVHLRYGIFKTSFLELAKYLL